MKVAYYTVDDLQLGQDPKGVTGWRLSHFLSLDDALTHYKSLLAAQEKSIGMTDGVHALEIARCVPLFACDREGEDILASYYKQFPLWADVEEAKAAVQTCTTALRLRYVLRPDAIVPIPKSDNLSSRLKDKYLWLDMNREIDSAIRLVYNAGTGWIPLKEWRCRASKHPLILKFKADGLTEGARMFFWRWSPGSMTCWFAARRNGLTKIHQKQEEKRNEDETNIDPLHVGTDTDDGTFSCGTGRKSGECGYFGSGMLPHFYYPQRG